MRDDKESQHHLGCCISQKTGQRGAPTGRCMAERLVEISHPLVAPDGAEIGGGNVVIRLVHTRRAINHANKSRAM